MTESVESVAEVIGEDQVEELKKFLSGAAPNIAEKGMDAPVFTNDKTSPAPFGMLDMVYGGVFSNTLGIMIARHRKSGRQVPLLVGVDGTTVYPVAIMIGAEQAAEFEAPDGEGGWIDVTEQG